MSKLYVFGIGGSGARVMKSLTMLLAAGLPARTERIVPMIIDTDINNGDLNNFRDIIKSYNKIHNTAKKGATAQGEKGFFRTQIDPPKELNISGSTYGTLAKMIDHATLTPNGFSMTKALTELLFGTKALNMDLEKGFLGSPNVGSIVLKDVVNTKGFKEFTQGFKPGDRIFIISSIFGGTGAAGFPLLLNLFRDEKSPMSNAAYIKNAIVGGVTLLPYFDVNKDNESAINSDTFIAKTKAALSYYNNYMKSNVDALFYIGDYRKGSYPNHDGGNKQKNPASFIEFASALAVLKFLNYEPSVEQRQQLSRPVKYFEFGIAEDVPAVNLMHLGGKKSQVSKSMIEFLLFNIYNTNYLQKALKNSKLAWHNTLDTPGNFGASEFVSELNDFASKYYYKWLVDMQLDKRHARSFKPFNLDVVNENEVADGTSATISLNVDDNALFNLVNGVEAYRKKSPFKKDNIDFDTSLNEITGKKKDDQGAEIPLYHRFMTLMHEMSNDIYKTRFSN